MLKDYEKLNYNKKTYEFRSLSETYEIIFKKYSSRTALVCGDRIVKYDELDKITNKIKSYLFKNLDTEEKSVSLWLDKSLEQAFAAIGIIRAGYVYVPIDYNAPVKRLEYCVGVSKSKLLITTEERVNDIDIEGVKVVSIDEVLNDTGDGSGCKPDIKPKDPFSIVFTSGSTGAPKGVILNQLGIAHVFEFSRQFFNFTEEDAVLSLSNYSHDASFFETFGFMLYGAKSVFPEKKDLKEPVKWFELMKKHDITYWLSVPSIMEMLLLSIEAEGIQDTLNKFRLVTVGGEFFPVNFYHRIKRIAPNADIYNLGGATETSILNIYHKVTEEDVKSGKIPYGIPIWNSTYWILDKNGKVLPKGIIGEICNGGICLTSGYLDEEKTKERFVWNDEVGELLYHTGDMGLINDDGIVEICGRDDSQIKINGERVELEEIIFAIDECSGVSACTVIPISDSNNKIKMLAAFVISNRKDLSIDELKKQISIKLPEYMVPGYWKFIERFPLTPNSKIDSKKLLQIYMDEAENSPSDELDNNSKATIIRNICTQNIGVPVADENQDLIEAGVHSLMAVKILHDIKIQTGITISMNEFYEEPTLANLIRSAESKSVSEESNDIDFQAFSEDAYAPFELTDIQMSYYLGQTEEAIGKIPTHAFLAIEGGKIDVERFNASLNKLIQRHDILRCVITEDKKQKILKDVPYLSAEIIELSDNDEDNIRQKVNEIGEYLLYHPNPQNEFPNFDIKLFKKPNGEYIVCALINSATIDGASIAILEDDLIKIYRGETLEPIGISFRDYVVNSSKIKETPYYKNSMEYWMNRLETLPDGPELNVKGGESRKVGNKVIHHRMLINSDRYQPFVENALQHKMTAVTAQIMAYALVMQRYSGNMDFTINIPTFNRFYLHKDVQNIAGEFGGIIFLQVHIEKDDTPASLGRRLQKQFAQDLDNHAVSGIDVIRNYKNKGRNFDSQVVFTSLTTQDERTFNRKDHPLYNWMTQSSMVWLDCILAEMENGLDIIWDASESVFEESMLADMFDLFGYTIEYLSNEQNWDKSLYYATTSPNEKTVEDINHTETVFEKEPELLHYGLYKNAKANPDKIACATEDRGITYAELYKRAQSVANELVKMGVKEEECVMVCMDRGYEQIIAEFGILMAKASYLPVNMQWPSERIKKVERKSNASFAVTTRSCAEITSTATKDYTKIIVIEDLEDAVDFEPDFTQDPYDMAYTIFTSGSTGEPKGVVIEHGAAINTIKDVNNQYSVNSYDTVFSVSEMCFDLSVYDVFGLILAGGTVYVPSLRERQEIDCWENIIKKWDITLWNSVPALAEMLAAYYTASVFSGIRVIMMSGDWIPLSLPEKLAGVCPNAKLISMGGATEASIWSIYYPIKEVKEDWRSIPYGYPMANQKMYVLNELGQVCPVNVPGHICIGGIGVARCYMNDTEKTNERFFDHPFMNERMYWTGDMGQYMSDGAIEFLGRADGQVKINGFRIELGEIESVSRTLENIDDAIALVDGEKINLYYIADENCDKRLEEILAGNVPEYMIPNAYIKVDSFPLSENGKVDRKKLLQIRNEVLSVDEITNETEQRVINIFEKVLNKTGIGVKDDFFRVGGDSIKAIQLMYEITGEFHISLKLSDIFKISSVKKLAEYIDMNHSRIDVIEHTEGLNEVPMTLAQLGIWFQIRSTEQKNQVNAFALAGHVFIDKDKFDQDVLNEALNILISRRKELRTEIFEKDYTPWIRYKDTFEYHINHIKLDMPSENAAQFMDLKVLEDLPELSGFPFFSVQTAETADDKAVVSLGISHLIADAYTISLFMGELEKIYYDLINDIHTEYDIPNYTYGDIALWEKKGMESGRYEEDISYWKNQLNDMPYMLLKEDNKWGDFKQKAIPLNISAHELERFEESCRNAGETLYTGLSAVMNVFLGYIFNQTDVVMGFGYAGRDRSEFKDIYGSFAVSSVLRTKVNETDKFKEILRKTSRNIKEIIRHSSLPFNVFVQKADADMKYAQLPYQILVNSLDTDQDNQLNLFSPFVYSMEISISAITLLATTANTKQPLSIVYRESLFEEDEIEEYGIIIENLIKLASEDFERKINTIYDSLDDLFR